MNNIIAILVVTGIFTGTYVAHSSYQEQAKTEDSVEVEAPEDPNICGLEFVECRTSERRDAQPDAGDVPRETENVVAAAVYSREQVKDLIIRYSGIYGVNKNTALRIAECESGFNQYAANKKSSAKGVYQFINRTWAGYCEGSVFDAEQNIKCFMQLYPKHPGWWECK